MLWGTTRAINEKSIPSKRKKKGKNKRKHERFVVVCQGRAGIFCLWVSNLNKHFLAVRTEGKKKKKDEIFPYHAGKALKNTQKASLT